MSFFDAYMSYVKSELVKRLIHPVSVVVLADELAEDERARQVCSLLRELACATSKLTVEEIGPHTDKDKIEFGLEYYPAIVLRGEKRFDVKFYGIPVGWEFSALVTDILIISSGEPTLSSEIRKTLSGFTIPVHIKVFVTPICPLCPRMVNFAHRLAIESPNIVADAIDVHRFPILAGQFKVNTVPKIVVNENKSIHSETQRKFLHELQAIQSLSR